MTKIIAFSDTHGQHENFKFPRTDILICAGDANLSSKTKAIDFLVWYTKQPAKHKLYIAGNHDWTCQNYSDWFRFECDIRHIKYLEHEACSIDGIKFFGSPYTPEFCGWAFMKERDQMVEMWKDIPEDTEILVTHGPAFGFLDKCPDSVGCEALRDRINELRKKELRYHIYGHIHEGAGRKRVDKMTFMNVSVLDGNYREYEFNIVNKTLEI